MAKRKLKSKKASNALKTAKVCKPNKGEPIPSANFIDNSSLVKLPLENEVEVGNTEFLPPPEIEEEQQLSLPDTEETESNSALNGI